METTTLDHEIVQYLPLLGVQEKLSLLSVIRTFLHEEESEDGQIKNDEYSNEIDAAIARVKSGVYYTHAEVKELLKHK